MHDLHNKGHGDVHHRGAYYPLYPFFRSACARKRAKKRKPYLRILNTINNIYLSKT
jgi:hypothetical protein